MEPGFLIWRKAGDTPRAQTSGVRHGGRAPGMPSTITIWRTSFPSSSGASTNSSSRARNSSSSTTSIRRWTKEIYRIEQDIETPSDDYTEELKVRRVRLKDRLYGMLTGRIPAVAETDEFVTRHKFAQPVDYGAVARNWIARGYSCRAFTDPPGREWRDFVHDTNELVTVVEGRLEVTLGGERRVLEPGDELFIPRGARHTVRNIHAASTRWLYGYD